MSIWPFSGSSSNNASSSHDNDIRTASPTIASSTSASSSRSSSPSPLLPSLSNPYISIPLSCTSVLGVSFLYTRYLRRIPSAEYITPRTLARKRIRGYVTSIGDADGFRIYHRPGPWLLGKLYPVPKDKKLLKDRTISIRLAGVDAPECAHFGKPAQPFSAEAQAFLTSLVFQRNIQLELLSKDQYGRIVGMAWVRNPSWWPVKSNVSLEMLKQGLATVYTQQGAEYGSVGKERLQQAEAKAKRKKKGMWSLAAGKYQSPAEYKKKHAG